MDCNGKCYLMQKIQKENDEKKQNLPPINLKDYPIGFVTILSIQFNNTLILKKESFTHPALYNNLFFASVYHPPDC